MTGLLDLGSVPALPTSRARRLRCHCAFRLPKQHKLAPLSGSHHRYHHPALDTGRSQTSKRPPQGKHQLGPLSLALRHHHHMGPGLPRVEVVLAAGTWPQAVHARWQHRWCRPVTHTKYHIPLSTDHSPVSHACSSHLPSCLPQAQAWTQQTRLQKHTERTNWTTHGCRVQKGKPCATHTTLARLLAFHLSPKMAPGHAKVTCSVPQTCLHTTTTTIGTSMMQNDSITLGRDRGNSAYKESTDRSRFTTRSFLPPR